MVLTHNLLDIGKTYRIEGENQLITEERKTEEHCKSAQKNKSFEREKLCDYIVQYNFEKISNAQN